MLLKKYLFPALLLFWACVSGCSPSKSIQADKSDVIAREMENALREQSLEKWYPLAVDTVYGGFLSNFDNQFNPEKTQEKMIVTQARHVWTTSKAAERYPDDKWYLESARHGFAFLKNVMWDSVYGGFYNLVDRSGKPVPDPDRSLSKQAYGNAFGVYGVAAYYLASKDPEGLDLAKKSFLWLEEHSHDPVKGGYFQFLKRDGTPIRSGVMGVPPKDQNSSIHLLEAFTELYKAWPDTLVRKRLEEIFLLIRDTMITPRGHLALFFTEDWVPVSYRDSSEAVRNAHINLDHVSYGHDVETAYLLLDASEVLGLKNATTTARKAKRLVDHALEYGWDYKSAGFYDKGYYFAGSEEPKVIAEAKVWWAEAEALNTLLLMSNLYPDDERDYYKRFTELWAYTKENLLDPTYGDWYEAGLDKTPDARKARKGHIWKGAYHTTRALTECLDGLKQRSKN